MKRSNLTLILSTIGLAVVGLLVVVGLVMAGNARFAKTYVKDQLSQQHITFTPLDKLTPEERQSACLVRYAGRALTTGKQAECYANDYIGLHVKSVANGKTYAELGGPERALAAQVTAAQTAGDPALPDLQKQHAIMKGQRDTLFQGETARGLLLTSFGFSDLGAKAAQAATTAYAVAALLALLSAGGLLRGLRRRDEAAAAPAAVRGPTDNRQLAGA